MKLNHEQHGNGREVESASGLQRSRRSLARARSQLTQAVGGVLSGALEGRRPSDGWLTAFGGHTPAPSAPTAERLRDVVIRDRALFAANPRPLRTLAMDDVTLDEATQDAQTKSQDGADARLSDARDDEGEAGVTDDPSLLEDDEPFNVAAHVLAHAPLASVKEASAKPVATDTVAKDAVAKNPAAKPVGREPIRTRTMARLLAAQGHRDRALSIYDDLLAKNGADASLREEAESLRSRTD